MIRVLHVINGRFYGGGHRLTLMLMQALDSDQFVAAELCTLGEGGQLSLRDRPSFVVPYDGQYNNPRALLAAARRLGSLIDERRPQILHTHGLDADLIGAISCLGRVSVKHISHLHITPPTGRRESFQASLRRLLLRFLTACKGTMFIAVSEAVRREMAAYYRLPLEQIVTVRNGIDCNEFGHVSRGNDVPREKLVIGAAGRLVPMKGFEHLLVAAKELANHGVPFELRIAGSGSLLSTLEKDALDFGVSSLVKFVGPVENMASFYHSLDIFVLPSISTEGLPLVVLEAMACGVTVLATRLGGSPEVIESGVNGLLVAPGDSQNLAKALIRLAGDDELRLFMAAKGAAHVKENFSVERVAVEVAALYRKELSNERIGIVDLAFSKIRVPFIS